MALYPDKQQSGDFQDNYCPDYIFDREHARQHRGVMPVTSVEFEVIGREDVITNLTSSDVVAAIDYSAISKKTRPESSNFL